MTTTWEQPTQVSGLDMAFGVRAVSDLMPAISEIPDEFKTWRGTSWNQVVTDWFFSGLQNAEWEPRDGIDTSEALRHVKAVLSSWEPKHEHKEAAVAYLLSLWFTDVTYTTGKATR